MMWKLNKRFANLGADYYQLTAPTPLVRQPRLVHFNDELLQQLGLSELSDRELLGLLSGQQTVADYPPLASIYMGHQFGVPVPQLGDGRALLIAEQQDPNGQVWELQLKGAGPTPYSRRGDGRAVLRSSIREYLASQAQAKLGIATTTALAMLTSKDPVIREEIEPAAVVLRVAPSFLRFGHFELFAHREQKEQLARLVDFSCRHYFPELERNDPQLVLSFLRQVVRRTAKMVAGWQAVGFVHGVMNSDNMSILGLTIDYGPYAFLEAFNPEQIFNHSDSEGRYTYAKQPFIAWWNLYRLAEALALLYPDSKALEEVLAAFAEDYNQYYLQFMLAKLGLSANQREQDLALIDDLLKLLQQHQVDWTYFWRQLSYAEAGRQRLAQAYPDLGLSEWYQRLDQRYQQAGTNAAAQSFAMLAANPALVLRMHYLQASIERAHLGDYTEIDRLFRAISSPYTELADCADLYCLPAAGLVCSTLSCSS